MSNIPFHRLIVWKKGISLTKIIYKVTSQFPQSELYGLTQQIRRAAVSIPSNIAEGSQRHSDRDFAHFLRIAKGSLAELETQFLIAQELGYVSQTDSEPLIEIRNLSKMLRAFIATIAIR